jgi:ElaB/YqjD/DUF883 family membrane-anchored ribosome-binding protein
MQENTENSSTANDRRPSGPTVRENMNQELHRLRDELSRTAHDIRMKTKGAGAEVQDTRRMLEREAKRFSAEVEEAVQRTQEDLLEAGKNLRMRFQKLANQVVLPPN